MKIVILTKLMCPYRLNFFNEISRLVGESNLKCIFEYEKFERHPWEMDYNNFKFNYFFINKKVGDKLKIIVFLKLIRKIEFTHAIIAGFNIYSVIFFLYCKLFGKKVIQWSEERLKPKKFFKTLLRKLLLRRFDLIIPVSMLSEKYFRNKYNIPDRKIFKILQSPYVENNCQVIKKTVAIGQKINILYVGQLVLYKNVIFLLKTISHIKNKTKQEFTLNIVGDGILRKKLEKYCKDSGLQKYVNFLGYVSSRERLEKIYNNNNIFFIGSTETYGVVLMEAASRGLVLLASSEVGAAYDLIEQGKNGYIYEYNNIAESTKYLLQLINNIDIINLYSQRSIEIAKQYTAKKLAKKLIDNLALIK